VSKSDFEKWLSLLKSAWKNGSSMEASMLFSDNVDYYETPFENYRGRQAVKLLWDEVPNTQTDINLKFERLSFFNSLGIAHWSAKYKLIKSGREITLDGIFVCEFDDNKLCKVFKQWWIEKDIC
jgi:SnoaL-like domain